jgi:hypothetical protein
LFDVVGGHFIDPANVDFFVEGLLGERIGHVFLCWRILLRDDTVFDQRLCHYRGQCERIAP